MSSVFRGVIAAALIAGSTVAATAPAQADRGTGAVIAGLFGLGIGAAIASDHHDRRYDDRVEYYAPPQVSYYNSGYGYGSGEGYGYAPRYGYGYPDRGGWDRRGWQSDGRRDGGRYYSDRRQWERDDER